MADTSSRFSLLGAARRILEGSLGIVPGERVVLIVDRDRADLAEALSDAGRDVRAKVEVIFLDTLGNRPFSSVPEPLRRALDAAQASVFLASTDLAELAFRTELIAVVSRPGLRHAHMVGVSRTVMEAAFSVDAARLRDVMLSLRARLRPDSRISVRSPAGTSLEIRCHPAYRYLENNGHIAAGRWKNLPGGELLAPPADVHGTFVADATLATLQRVREDTCRRTPVELAIDHGVVRTIRCADLHLRSAVERFLVSGRNRDRIGLFSFGANVGLAEPIGFALADQTLPGVHLVLGATFSAVTGATWDADAQLLAGGTRADVDIDGNAVMRRGRYLF